MVLDIEGAEERALAGMRGAAVLPRVLVVETDKGARRPIDDLVFGMGYKMHSEMHGNSAYLMEAR
jgi:hypothetical protein